MAFPFDPKTLFNPSQLPQQMTNYMAAPQQPQFQQTGLQGLFQDPNFAGGLGQLLVTLLGGKQGGYAGQGFGNMWQQIEQIQRQARLDEEARKRQEEEIRLAQESGKLAKQSLSLKEKQLQLQQVKDLLTDLDPNVTYEQLLAEQPDLASQISRTQFRGAQIQAQRTKQKEDNELLAQTFGLKEAQVKALLSLLTVNPNANIPGLTDQIPPESLATVRDMASVLVNDQHLSKQQKTLELASKLSLEYSRQFVNLPAGNIAVNPNTRETLRGLPPTAAAGTSTLPPAELAKRAAPWVKAVLNGEAKLENVPIKDGLRDYVVQQKGDRTILPASVRKKVTQLQRAITVIDQIAEAALKVVSQKEGPQARLAGIGKAIQGKLGLDPDVSNLDAKTGMLPIILRNVMDTVGTLSDLDVQRGIALLPNKYHTKQEVEDRLTGLYGIIRGAYEGLASEVGTTAEELLGEYAPNFVSMSEEELTKYIENHPNTPAARRAGNFLKYRNPGLVNRVKP